MVDLMHIDNVDQQKCVHRLSARHSRVRWRFRALYVSALVQGAFRPAGSNLSISNRSSHEDLRSAHKVGELHQ
jgi:hypothetical protein